MTRAIAALRAYRTHLEDTEAYKSAHDVTTVEAEIARVLDAVGRQPDAEINVTDSLILKLPDGDMAFGTGHWDGGPPSSGGVFRWEFGFIERWTVWEWNGETWGVEQSLYPDGTGGLWVGQNNNSSYDPLKPPEALQAWTARREMSGRVVQ